MEGAQAEMSRLVAALGFKCVLNWVFLQLCGVTCPVVTSSHVHLEAQCVTWSGVVLSIEWNNHYPLGGIIIS